MVAHSPATLDFWWLRHFKAISRVSLEGEKRSLVELLNAACNAACKATDLQHEAAQSHMRACGELKKITELFSEAGPAAGVLILVHCDNACQ